MKKPRARKSWGNVANLLPIVSRELRVASRKPANHRTRTLFAVVMAGALAWRLIVLNAQNAPQASQGRAVFTTLMLFAFLYALFIGARTTADSLSSEKREGTLGLLFLTDLKPFNVVLGKLVASSLNGSYGLLAAIPFLAIPVLMGGVTGAEFLRGGVALTTTLLLSLSIGIFVSSISHNERKALFATAMLLLSVSLGPLVLAFYIVSEWQGRLFPGISEIIVIGGILTISPVLGIMDMLMNFGPVRIPKQFLWVNQLIMVLISLVLIRWSNRIVARSWSDKPLSPRMARLQTWWQELLHGSGATRRSFRDRLLDLNAFTWLVSRERMKPAYAWGFVLSLSAIWLWSWFRHSSVVFDWYPAAPTFLIIHAFAKLWVASEASHRLVEDQRAGAMELLLSTPMTPERIVEGQWIAFRRQFLKPYALLCFLEWIAFFSVLSWWTILAVQLVFWIDLWAIVYLGLWNGLVARNLTQALFRVAGAVLFLPWGIFTLLIGPGGVFPRWMGFARPQTEFETRLFWWAIICVVNSLAWGFWAKRNLLHNFRSSVLARFTKPRAGG